MKRARALATATVAAAVSLALATPVEAVVADQPDPGTASFNGAVRTVLSVGATTYVGGDFTAANTASGSVPRARVAAIDTATGQLLPFDPGANGPVWSLAADGTDVYLGGSFTAVGGQPRKNIAEVDAVSSPQGQVTGWRASMSSRVRALTVADGVLYAGGQFLSVSGVARSRLAAFDLGTGALTAWAPRADKPVFDLLATPRRIYVAGAFDSINLQTAADSLAALDPVSGDPQSWDPTISYPVRALDTDGTTPFAAGAWAHDLEPGGSRTGPRWCRSAGAGAAPGASGRGVTPRVRGGRTSVADALLAITGWQPVALDADTLEPSSAPLTTPAQVWGHYRHRNADGAGLDLGRQPGGVVVVAVHATRQAWTD